MRISFKTTKRRLLIATGDDASEAEDAAGEWVQMSAGAFEIAPTEEDTSYEEEEEEWIPDEMNGQPKSAHSFGFGASGSTVRL